MKNELVTIKLSDYLELKKIEKAMKTKPHCILITTYDGYIDSKVYAGYEAIPKIVESVESVLEDYDRKHRKNQPAKKTWIHHVFENLKDAIV